MVNNAIPTVVLLPNTYYKVAGITAVGQTLNFTGLVSNKLVYTGTSVCCRVNCFSTILQPNGNNQVMSLAIFKNGVMIPSSESSFQNTSTNSKIPVTSTGLVYLSTNDYVEVFVKNTTGANNMIVSYMNLNLN